MTRKKGKLMTFLWSLIPGAGEMYLGFFKQGTSIMAAFLLIFGVSGFLQLGFLTFLAPILWFYSFFHSNNLAGLPDDEFYSMEDDFLFRLNHLPLTKESVRKHQKVIAGCLIFFGISILWNNFSRLLFRYILPTLNLTDEAMHIIDYITESIPQGIVAVAVIILGVLMIKGKYEDLKNDDSLIPSPPYLEDKKSNS